MEPLLESKSPKPRKGVVKKCEECGVEFYAYPGFADKRRYCSKPCLFKGQDKRKRAECVVCGEKFIHNSNVGGKYCSRRCYLKDREPRKACKTCGKALEVSRLTYCSVPCMSADRKTGKEKPCEMCGKVMIVTPYEWDKKRFCSRACTVEKRKLAGPGARVKRQDGYIAVYYPTHPDATSGKMVLEHRLVAEQKYGRRIRRDEHVHHLNGIRDDNRPENLEVISASVHAGISNKQGKQQRKDARAELEEYRRRFGPLKKE